MTEFPQRLGFDLPDPLSSHIKFLSDFFQCVRAAVFQRRKTQLNCIGGYFSLPKSQADEILIAAGIPENTRAEQLPLDGFGRLADALFDAGVPAKK